MSKLIRIAKWLSINPEEVTSIRSNGTRYGSPELYIEMTTGTRHAVRNVTVEQLTALLNEEVPNEGSG